MRRVLIDADAFLIVRHLSLLDRIRSIRPPPPLVATGHVARHELRAVASLVRELQEEGTLVIEDVKLKTPAGALFKELKRAADEGEAEAVAWAVTSGADGLIFISNDKGARKLAASRRVAAGDVLDLIVEMVEGGHMSREDAETLVNAKNWNDPEHQFGRPPDYTNFAETFAKRKGRRQQRGT